jgi:hypothetical protein
VQAAMNVTNTNQVSRRAANLMVQQCGPACFVPRNRMGATLFVAGSCQKTRLEHAKEKPRGGAGPLSLPEAITRLLVLLSRLVVLAALLSALSGLLRLLTGILLARVALLSALAALLILLAALILIILVHGNLLDDPPDDDQRAPRKLRSTL